MCQLLGLSAAKPVSIAMSLGGFVQRGGITGDHRDGWGIAYSDGEAWHRHSSCLPASRCPRMRDLLGVPVRARSYVVHVRKATRGAVVPDNCHPFVRELWGRSWVFAHNGNLDGFAPSLDAHWRVRGTTDSEHAFCFLLQSLEARFGTGAPPRAQLFEAIAELARSVACFGSFNFLLSDGADLFAFCSTDLHVLERAYPFARARRVDLHDEVDFARLCHLDDRMCVIATHPLTAGEPWQAMRRSELRLFRAGVAALPGHLAPRPLAVAV